MVCPCHCLVGDLLCALCVCGCCWITTAALVGGILIAIADNVPKRAEDEVMTSGISILALGLCFGFGCLAALVYKKLFSSTPRTQVILIGADSEASRGQFFPPQLPTTSTGVTSLQVGSTYPPSAPPRYEDAARGP